MNQRPTDYDSAALPLSYAGDRSFHRGNSPSESEESKRKSGKKRQAERQDKTPENPDAELAALVAAWPTLPAHIKAAVRALIETAKPKEEEEENGGERP